MTASLVLLASGAAGQAESTLQERVEALGQQIDLRYGSHEPSLRPRRDGVDSVLVEWNALVRTNKAEVSPENKRRMDRWLDAALRAMMAGGSGQLPQAPRFSEPVTRLKPKTPSIVAERRPMTSDRPRVAAEARTPEATPAPSRVAVEPKRVEPLAVTPRETTHRRPQSRFAGPRASRSPATPLPPRVATRRPVAVDPFADDPAASPNPLRVAQRASRRPEFDSRDESGINFRRLAAEVRGYNAALRDLQSAVMRLKATDLRGLQAASDELARLERRREFIDLYREGLAVERRRLLPTSPSPELVRELLNRRTSVVGQQSAPARGADRQATGQPRQTVGL